MHSDKLPTGPAPEEIDESSALSDRPADTDAAPDTVLKSPYGETPAVARASILAAASAAPTAHTPADAEANAQTQQTAPVEPVVDTAAPVAPSAITPAEPDAAPDAAEASEVAPTETASTPEDGQASPAPAESACQ